MDIVDNYFAEGDLLTRGHEWRYDANHEHT